MELNGKVNLRVCDHLKLPLCAHRRRVRAKHKYTMNYVPPVTKPYIYIGAISNPFKVMVTLGVSVCICVTLGVRRTKPPRLESTKPVAISSV